MQAYFDRTLRTDSSSIGEARDTIDIDFIHHFHLSPKHQFSYGAGLHWSPYQIFPPNPNETLIPANATDHVHTGFVQDQIQLGEKLFLTLGAKLQHNNYSGFDIQPSARLLWSPSEHQSVWLGVTRAVTTPSDLEEDFHLEGAVSPSVAIVVAGNPNFKSEDVLGYELGYRRLITNKFYLDVASFWSQYAHLQSFSAPMISSTGGITYVTTEYENQIGGFTTGFEISPQLAIARWWRLNSNYSYVSSNFHAIGATSDISSTGSVATYEKSSPKHNFTVQSKLDLPMRFQFDQIYRYVSDLPAQNVRAYQTMDLRLGRALGRNVSIEVVGQDLFQRQHYEWGTGDPSQPLVGIYRAAYIKLSFKTKP